MKINIDEKKPDLKKEADSMEAMQELHKILAKPRNYPNFIDAYLDFTKHQESTTKIHKWVAISIIAAALERKVYLDHGYFKTFPNMYIFVIGESGVVRKSTSTGIGVDLLRDLESINIMSERVTAASLIQQMERSGETYPVGAREEKQSAVYCYASELNVFLREVFGSISELLTTFFDCSPHDSAKPWVYETKGEGQVKIFGPCLNILGASTQAWLSRAIPANEMEGGFSSRVIFVVEKENPDNFVAWPELQASVHGVRPKLLEDLRQINNLRGVFNKTQAAHDFYEQWYVTFKRQIRRMDSRFKGYYGRKPTMVWKLAMILSVAEGNSLTFDVPHIQKAIELLDEIEETMFEAFGASGENRQAKGIHNVQNLIEGRTEVGHKEIMNLLWRDFTGAEIKQILSDLLQMGYLSQSFVRNREYFYKVIK
jgi:hypothetical protein